MNNGDVITRQEARDNWERAWEEDPRTILRRDEIQDVLGASLADVGLMDVDAAREIVRQMIYLLMHMVQDEDGRLSTRVEAQKILRTYYPELLEAANLKLSLRTVEVYRKEIADRIWKERYPDMMKLTQGRFKERMQQFDLVMPQIMEAISRGNLKLIPDFVMMVKLESDILGYRAAEKVRLVLGEEDQGMTDEDMIQAANASSVAAAYDQELLAAKISQVSGGALEGQIADRNELERVLLESAEGAKEGLDAFVDEISKGIDEQVRAQAGTDEDADDEADRGSSHL